MDLEEEKAEAQKAVAMPFHAWPSESVLICAA
jgi:hypothetical protein